MNETEIREGLRTGALSPESALSVVDKLIVLEPSAALWVLRGGLIQLCDEPVHPLEEAARSYLQAAALSPTAPEPLEELGHFYDAVVPEPERAKAYYRAALALGAGVECELALSELEAETA